MTRRCSPSCRQISSPPIGRRLIFDLNQCCGCSGRGVLIYSPGNTEINECQSPAKATVRLLQDGGCSNVKNQEDVKKNTSMQTKIQVLSLKKKISYSCRVKSHTYIRYSAKWFGNKNVVMAHICKHWMYNSCFSASLRFPACKCSLCDSWYYSCVQRRLGKADTGAFQNNRCVDEISSTNQFDVQNQHVNAWRWTCLCLWKVVFCLGGRWRELELWWACVRSSEERLRSADQVTWLHESGWSQTKTFLGRLGNRITILKGEPWLGFKS